MIQEINKTAFNNLLATRTSKKGLGLNSCNDDDEYKLGSVSIYPLSDTSENYAIKVLDQHEETLTHYVADWEDACKMMNTFFLKQL